MIVECSHCGAPLDVSESAAIVKCRYCAAKTERKLARTISEQTPKDFEPPKKWTPPAQFPADSSKELEYNGGSNVGCSIFGILVLLAIPAIIIVASLQSCSGILNAEPSKLARTAKLDGNPEQLEKTFGGSPSENSLNVSLHSDIYDYVSFSWDAKYPDHPTSFYMRTREGKRDEGARTRLGAMLRGGLDQDGSWSWESVGISYDKDSGSINAHSDPREGENKLWKRQLDACWLVVMNVAFAQDVAPSKQEMIELLGAGYPFASISEISPQTNVSKAESAVRSVFPGAYIENSSGVRAVIAVDHPAFKNVALWWMNSRDATLHNADFFLFDTSNAKRDALATCLTPKLGNPSISDADFMRKVKSYSWNIDQMGVHLSENDLSISASWPGSKPSNDAWVKILNAINACR